MPPQVITKMKLKTKDNQLLVETNIYQARTGAIFLNWGNTVIKLEEHQTGSFCYDIPNFNAEDFNNYYSDKK